MMEVQVCSWLAVVDGGCVALDQGFSELLLPIFTPGVITGNPHTGGHPALRGYEPRAMLGRGALRASGYCLTLIIS